MYFRNGQVIKHLGVRSALDMYLSLPIALRTAKLHRVLAVLLAVGLSSLDLTFFEKIADETFVLCFLVVKELIYMLSTVTRCKLGVSLYH